MTAYLLIFAAAVVLAFGGTPVARRLALRVGVVDHPSARKAHLKTTPLLGGLAIYGAAVLALLAFGDRFYIEQMVGILVGASLVSFLGIWDDRSGLRPMAKLLGQIVAALLLVAADIRIGVLHNDLLNIVATVLWIVAITNSFNLLDNMDGLSGGIAVISCAFLFLLAASSGQFLVASLAIALLGACLGFLRYNFNPATIFMGDTGSLFLGFTIAALAIKLRFDNLDVVTWMVPVLVLGVPLFDTTLVVVSRLRRRLNPLTTPGKDHISHRLVALGWTTREAVMALYLAGGTLGLAAMVVMRATFVEGYLIGGMAAAGALFALYKLEMGFGGFDGRHYRNRPQAGAQREELPAGAPADHGSGRP
jgi:UDP-GlcNAc:undecaprenyl-phosphate GlcNAc-1-phosphate transferase